MIILHLFIIMKNYIDIVVLIIIIIYLINHILFILFVYSFISMILISHNIFITVNEYYDKLICLIKIYSLMFYLMMKNQ